VTFQNAAPWSAFAYDSSITGRDIKIILCAFSLISIADEMPVLASRPYLIRVRSRHTIVVESTVRANVCLFLLHTRQRIETPVRILCVVVAYAFASSLNRFASKSEKAEGGRTMKSRFLPF